MSWVNYNFSLQNVTIRSASFKGKLTALETLATNPQEETLCKLLRNSVGKSYGFDVNEGAAILRVRGVTFIAVLMDMCKHADTSNVDAIVSIFPSLFRETAKRYNAPGGLIWKEDLESAEFKRWAKKAGIDAAWVEHLKLNLPCQQYWLTDNP